MTSSPRILSLAVTGYVTRNIKTKSAFCAPRLGKCNSNANL
jgi:hypothetical protein